MIGLGANVVVRYLTQDDPVQSEKANHIIDTQLSANSCGFISMICLIEVVWVLESCYEQGKEDVVRVVSALLNTKQLLVEHADLVYIALKRFQAANGDFSDALIVAVSEDVGCSKVFTFDKKAKSVGMSLL